MFNRRRRRSSGVSYLISDSFTTADAAPVATPRVCEPGPGGALVRDVENKIALNAGWAKFTVQATPVYAEQDLVFNTPATPRIANRVVIAKYNLKTDAAHYPLAFVSSTTPAWNHTNVEHGFWRSAAGKLSAVNAGVLGPEIATISINTDYYLAIVLRASGADFYIKGGSYSNWTHIYEGMVGSASTVYPAAAGYSAEFWLSFVRVPSASADHVESGWSQFVAEEEG